MPAEHLTAHMTLDTLLERLAAAPAIPVADITIDSRSVRPGSVFIATAGATHHGVDFLSLARDSGAVACVYDSSTAGKVPASFDIPLIPVASLASHLGDIANRFFDAPSAQIDVIGVTGTNGKSTVAWMLSRCLKTLGHRCGYAGTLGYGMGDIRASSAMTTPDVIETHRRLASFRDDGASHAAIEVSSHALDQGRVNGVRFGAALFTNLSRDHLDYHGDMQAYGEAKARLFVEHRANSRIVNIDSDFGARLAARCGNDVVTVSARFDREAVHRQHVIVRSATTRPGGSDIRIESSWGAEEFFLPMPGDYNVANAALALAYLLVDGAELHAACDALQRMDSPPGRMQRVNAPGPRTYIDYAHSPNALEVALHALRAHGTGKLWCVFGCGGDRDRGKRPEMGAIAERLADHVVITSDNPRGEPPADIIDNILDGLRKPGDVTVIEDRAAAIAWAIANAGDDDQVLIAGKGHEQFQLVGSEAIPFSDYAVAEQSITARGAGGTG